MLGIFLITSGVFGVMFYTQKTLAIPTDIQTTIDPNAAPSFYQIIYGDFGDGAMNKPMDVTFANQWIYVSDTNNKRVQVFDSAGSFLFNFGKEGAGKGEFKFPYGIAGDSAGNIYVADLYNGNISIFDSKGVFKDYFKVEGKEKHIVAPAGLRIFNDKLYVTDVQNSKAYVFSLDGKLLREIGKVGLENGQFRAPNAITIDKDENIYVTDTGNQRIQVFNKEGKFLRIVNGNENGKGDSIFVNPRGIAIDSRGILYVVSNLTHFVYGFDKEGKQVFVFGGNGDANDRFGLPNGLFIDENDRVYITDTTNRRVAVYY